MVGSFNGEALQDSLPNSLSSASNPPMREDSRADRFRYADLP